MSRYCAKISLLTAGQVRGELRNWAAREESKEFPDQPRKSRPGAGVWYRCTVIRRPPLPWKRFAMQRKKKKKEKVAAWEVPTLNNAVLNWYHRGLCAVCMLLVFIIESPNSNDLKGIWLFYINHKLYSRGWEQVGRYPGVVALRSSHYNHPAKSKEKP